MKNSPQIYMASKLCHAEKWKALRGFRNISSSWIDLVGSIDDNLFNAPIFWRRNFEDIKASNFLIVYTTPEERLRGALIEVGFAIAHKLIVIIIGTHPDLGTWQYSSEVYKAKDLNHAFWIVDHLWPA